MNEEPKIEDLKAEMDRMSDLIGKLQKTEHSNMPSHLRCADVNGGK